MKPIKSKTTRNKRKRDESSFDFRAQGFVGISCLILLVMWYFNIWAMNTIHEMTLLVKLPSLINKQQAANILAHGTTPLGDSSNVDRLEEAFRDTYNDNESLDTPNNSSSNSNSNISSTSSSRSRSQKSPYAYVWVIGGIREDSYGYKGFMWDVLISANLLRKMGSTADFCIFVRLSPTSTLNDLPHEDRRLLETLGVNIILLEKPQHESFSQLVFDKFLTINMTDYKRVMFLDADIVPLTNLDYIFHLSDPDYKTVPTLLKPNLITASNGEPCNTGIFMVEPSKVGFELYQEAVAKQRERAKTLPYPYFDALEGWGHNFIKYRDHWQSVYRKSKRWSFHASHSDQGLMYYWAKYQCQNVTILISDIVQNWKPGRDGQPVLESETKGILADYQGKVLFQQWSCDHPERADDSEKKNAWRCVPFFDGFTHFAGKWKPWKALWKKNLYTKSSYRRQAAKYLWFDELIELNQKYGMGLDMENWDAKYPDLLKKGSIGTIAKYTDQEKVFGISENVEEEAEQRVGGGAEEGGEGAEESDEEHEGNVLDQDSNDPPKMESAAGNLTRKKKENNSSIPLVVAYAVSFIKCGDHQNNAAGLVDASLVLRHSIHKISIRNPSSGSKYDYKMYAIVHRQAQECANILEKTGFEVIVVDPPLEKQDIRGDFLRTHIHKERCCGHDEFIKLHAYKLPEDIIVHVDIDFAFYKPMDHLFDAILYPKNTVTGEAARNAIELERPGVILPDQIGAFLTRDWPQVIPGKWPAGYQAGFLVARRDPSIADEMVEIIKAGNYSEGWGYGHGWGDMGYGGWVGAMAMQGLVAYYYDHIRPNNAVELNQCNYNHMGMDVTHKGKCRNGQDECQDCRETNMDDIYSMHYTMCRKPWLCQATGAKGGKKPNGGGRGTALNTDVVDVEHCLLMARQWHLLRYDLESSLYNLTRDETLKSGMSGEYKPDIFQGHCKDDGEEYYLPIARGGDEDSTFARIQELYHR